MIFCNNDPCEAEAVFYYVTDKGVRFHLCYTCMEAFMLGQVNDTKYLYGIDDDPDEEHLDGLTWPEEEGEDE